MARDELPHQALSYLFTADNWFGPVGLALGRWSIWNTPRRRWRFSALVAVPIGLVVGHTRRGTLVVVSLVNALRALPTLGVLLLAVLLWGLGLIPPIVALMLLGIPPLLAGTYAGVSAVDRTVVDAARSMGMSELRVLFRVEVPNALPLIIGGFRTATLQVVATATVAAYASLGGLGRYLIDGIKVRQFHIALVGALMVDGAGADLDGVLASRCGRRCRLPGDAPKATPPDVDIVSSRRLTWTREPSPLRPDEQHAGRRC